MHAHTTGFKNCVHTAKLWAYVRSREQLMAIDSLSTGLTASLLYPPQLPS